MRPVSPAGRSVRSLLDVPGAGRFGLSICYDMWFPETTRTLSLDGAEVVIHPTMTNTVDRDVERSIARASAATNQLFFVDVNVAGPLGLGLSGVYGPGGEIIHQAGSGYDAFAVELDLDQVSRCRERGWHGLGQMLKSFRDKPIDFLRPIATGPPPRRRLTGLGPLVTPRPEREG